MDQRAVSGVITAWTAPVRDREGFTCVLALHCDDGLPFSLSVTLSSVEDHEWHVGQAVVARDVWFDSLVQGRTYENVGQEEKEERAFPFFLDLPLNKIASLQREESGALVARFVDGVVVTCVDEAKSKELLDVRIGGFVNLFNVKSTHRGLFVTSKSGVSRLVVLEPPPPPLSPPRPCQPPRPLYKWQCIVCAHVNYPSKSVCYGCGYTSQI
jgi:hypothetical protein